MADQTIYDWGGVRFAFGARQRPFDPREVAYRLTPPTLVDLSVPRSLGPWRTRVENQMTMGACVAHAVTSAAEMLARMGGATPPELDRLWLYYKSRVKEKTFPQDAGSYPADALDIAMAGLPPESAEPLGYVADPTYAPPASVDAAATLDFVASHRPFYATDPQGFVGGLCAALDQRLPVVLALGWHQDFFNPPGGVLPVRDPHSGIVGGHCVLAWGYTPIQGGLVWCRNSWGPEWTASVAAAMRALNPEAEPGDFAIPAALFANGIVWEARAVSGEPVQPSPPPTPDGYQRALDVAAAEFKRLDALIDKNPRSSKAKYTAAGAGSVVNALVKAK